MPVAPIQEVLGRFSLPVMEDFYAAVPKHTSLIVPRDLEGSSLDTLLCFCFKKC